MKCCHLQGGRNTAKEEATLIGWSQPATTNPAYKLNTEPQIILKKVAEVVVSQ